MKKALFLDRDGVINKMVRKHSKWYNKIIDGSPFTPEEFEFNPGIKEIVEYAKSKKYEIICITNQPSILKKDFSLNDYEEITKKMCEGLEIDRGNIFECLHKEGLSLPCNCRKPKPGLILMAKGVFDIDLKNSILVGDSYADIYAGKSAGVGKNIFVRRLKNEFQEGNSKHEDKMNEEKKFPDEIIESLDSLKDFL
jgi:D-glycero-D-manno-heptose 1,7-bisphosphate phosphatase